MYPASVVGRRIAQGVTAATLLFGLQGCVALALPLLASGAGIGASAGIDYATNAIAYRTFSTSQEQLRTAILAALRRMAIPIKTDERTEEGRKIVAEVTDRTVEIELERITAKTTRMRVVVKRGFFLRDRATAGEIVVRTEQAVDGGVPALTRTKITY